MPKVKMILILLILVIIGLGCNRATYCAAYSYKKPTKTIKTSKNKKETIFY